jgi:hypothetical protein
MVVLLQKLTQAPTILRTNADTFAVFSATSTRETDALHAEIGVLDKKTFEKVTKEEKKEKRKPDQERLSKLAKPKDKWKVGKKLVELQKMFPHDRVLERMIAEEFSKNQAFRYPAEYDVYNKQEDDKLKIFSEGKKLAKTSYGDFGSTKLEEFKLEDKSSQAGDQRKAAMERKARLAFEKDIFNEATAYQHKAQTRLSAAEDTKHETMRQ